MTARATFTDAALRRARPSRDEIELARLQLSKIVGGGGEHSLDLRHYAQEDITDLFCKNKAPVNPHSIRAGFVYVAGFAQFVKIGWTTDVKCRIYSIEQGLPETFVLYHSFGGTQKDERALHRRFKSLRTRGEWFRHEGELAEWIRAGYPI
jgi:hypothetical protein